MNKKNKTNKDYLSNLLSFIESKEEVPLYDVDQILTDAGYKPDEVGNKFQTIADQSAAKSPNNWRTRAHNAHEDAKADFLKKKSIAKTSRSRSELMDAINALLSQQNLNIAFAHRNFNNQTDEDLESLLNQLEYIAAQRSKIRKNNMSFPELAAQRVIKTLSISCIEDLYLTNEIAWQRGALVIEEKLTGAEARLIISSPRSVITVSTNVTDFNRRRFGATHEIGHLEMHRGQCSVFNCSKEDLDSGGIKNKPSPTMENEANEFAANLLMPKQFFAPFCERADLNLDAIGEGAKKFQVSLTAAALRFIQISKEPLAIVVSSNGYIRWFEANKDFYELGLFVDVGERLSRETLAIRAFQGASIPSKPSQVPIGAWMRSGRYSPRATLSEQSLAMPNYNSVLSLIWINEVIDDDDWFG